MPSYSACASGCFLKAPRAGARGFVLPEMSLNRFARAWLYADRRAAAQGVGRRMRSGVCMNQLVQGDVGSGKTAVAPPGVGDRRGRRADGAYGAHRCWHPSISATLHRSLSGWGLGRAHRGKQPAAARREVKGGGRLSASLIISTRAITGRGTPISAWWSATNITDSAWPAE